MARKPHFILERWPLPGTVCLVNNALNSYYRKIEALVPSG